MDSSRPISNKRNSTPSSDSFSTSSRLRNRLQGQGRGEQSSFSASYRGWLCGAGCKAMREEGLATGRTWRGQNESSRGGRGRMVLGKRAGRREERQGGAPSRGWQVRRAGNGSGKQGSRRAPEARRGLPPETYQHDSLWKDEEQLGGAAGCTTAAAAVAALAAASSRLLCPGCLTGRPGDQLVGGWRAEQRPACQHVPTAPCTHPHPAYASVPFRASSSPTNAT